MFLSYDEIRSLIERWSNVLSQRGLRWDSNYLRLLTFTPTTITVMGVNIGWDTNTQPVTLHEGDGLIYNEGMDVYAIPSWKIPLYTSGIRNILVEVCHLAELRDLWWTVDPSTVEFKNQVVIGLDCFQSTVHEGVCWWAFLYRGILICETNDDGNHRWHIWGTTPDAAMDAAMAIAAVEAAKPLSMKEETFMNAIKTAFIKIREKKDSDIPLR